MTAPLFFFSYARNDRDNAKRHSIDGKPQQNMLDHFFDDLSMKVASLTPMTAEEVGFRDRNGITYGHDWDKTLKEKLCCAQTMVALVSPSYFTSTNCGREFHLFDSRHQDIKETNKCNRILPLFWQPTDRCFKGELARMRDRVGQYQYSTHLLPETYPSEGICNILECWDRQSYFDVLRRLADLIVATAEATPDLPPAKIEDDVKFTDLPSAFDGAVDTSIAAPPKPMADIEPSAPATSASLLPGFSSFWRKKP